MTSDKVLRWFNVLSLYCKNMHSLNPQNSLIYGTTCLIVAVVVVAAVDVAVAAAAAAAVADVGLAPYHDCC